MSGGAAPTPPLVVRVARQDRTLGWLAVDSLVAGRCYGGLRLMPDVTEEEVRGLARAMTLKHGFLGLPFGGAKAGLIGDPEAPRAERLASLTEFARGLGPWLSRRAYVPGSDMGTSREDVRDVLGAIGVRPFASQLRGTETGVFTALSTLAGALAGARALSLDLRGATAAIEGFGKVGRPLAQLLAERGVRVVAVSTSLGARFDPSGLDVARLDRLAVAEGSRFVLGNAPGRPIPREALLELAVDVLCPCARNAALRSDNAPRIAARVVSSGANNSVTPDAERILVERGVLVLPDFVTNSGGVLGGTMDSAGIPRARLEPFVLSRLEAELTSLLDAARARQSSVRSVAAERSRRRFAAARRRAETPSLRGRLFGAGLSLQRRGLLPARLVAALAWPWFQRTVCREREAG